jgi:hypothetical protein
MRSKSKGLLALIPLLFYTSTTESYGCCIDLLPYFALTSFVIFAFPVHDSQTAAAVWVLGI